MSVNVHGIRERFYGGLAVFFGLCATVFSQRDAFLNPFLVNDDTCQHIWWLRSLSDPALFQGDLLAQYARSLEHVGLLVVYRLTSLFIDPLDVARLFPFFLMPFSAWFVFRLVRAWTGEDFTALLSAAVFAVTPVYLQHMVGGQAHSFAFPLLVAFCYFFAADRPVGAAAVLLVSVFFFPVIFLVGVTGWIIRMLVSGDRGRFYAKGWKYWSYVVVAGLVVLLVRFTTATLDQIGHPLTIERISRMPELSADGRWPVWPVEPVFLAAPGFMQSGMGVFQGLRKSFLAEPSKQYLIDGHMLLLVVMVFSWIWWRRRRPIVLRSFFIPLAAAGILCYLVAGRCMFWMYAPDRYLIYIMPLLTLLFVIVPLGMAAAEFGQRYVAAIVRCSILVLFLGLAFLTRNAGLRDYSEHSGLYRYLSSLPKTVLIAARPDVADAIPLFSRRSVYVSFEMSVPLYDRYWETISGRIRQFIKMYYSSDLDTLARFLRQEGITHLVFDRGDLVGREPSREAYFQPFRSEVKALIADRTRFGLSRIPESSCEYVTGTFCVVSRAMIEQLAATVRK